MVHSILVSLLPDWTEILLRPVLLQTRAKPDGRKCYLSIKIKGCKVCTWKSHKFLGSGASHLERASCINLLAWRHRACRRRRGRLCPFFPKTWPVTLPSKDTLPLISTLATCLPMGPVTAKWFICLPGSRALTLHHSRTFSGSGTFEGSISGLQYTTPTFTHSQFGSRTTSVVAIRHNQTETAITTFANNVATVIGNTIDTIKGLASQLSGNHHHVAIMITRSHC